MNRMVGELLDLAPIETGQVVMRREAGHIEQLLQMVVERLALRPRKAASCATPTSPLAYPRSSAMAIAGARSSAI